MARRGRPITKSGIYRKLKKGRFGKGAIGGFCSGMIGVDEVVSSFEKTAATKTPLGKGIRKIASLEHKFRKGVCGTSEFSKESLRRAKMFRD